MVLRQWVKLQYYMLLQNVLLIYASFFSFYHLTGKSYHYDKINNYLTSCEHGTVSLRVCMNILR